MFTNPYLRSTTDTALRSLSVPVLDPFSLPVPGPAPVPVPTTEEQLEQRPGLMEQLMEQLNPSTHLNPLILPLIPSALYEPTGG